MALAGTLPSVPALTASTRTESVPGWMVVPPMTLALGMLAVDSVRKRTPESVETTLPAGMERLPVVSKLEKVTEPLAFVSVIRTPVAVKSPSAASGMVTSSAGMMPAETSGSMAVGSAVTVRDTGPMVSMGAATVIVAWGRTTTARATARTPTTATTARMPTSAPRPPRAPVERTGPPTTGRAPEDRGPGPRGGGGTEATSAPKAARGRRVGRGIGVARPPAAVRRSRPRRARAGPTP